MQTRWTSRVMGCRAQPIADAWGSPRERTRWPAAGASESGTRDSGHPAKHATGFTDPDRLMQIADRRRSRLRLAGDGDGGGHAEHCNQGGGGGGRDDELAHGGVLLADRPVATAM